MKTKAPPIGYRAKGRGTVKCVMTGKICHTRSQAKKHAAALRRASASNKPIDVYKCPDWKLHSDLSKQFHVGHTPSKKWQPGSIG